MFKEMSLPKLFVFAAVMTTSLLAPLELEALRNPLRLSVAEKGQMIALQTVQRYWIALADIEFSLTAKSTRIYKSYPIDPIGTPTAVFNGTSLLPVSPSETRVLAHTICPPSQTPLQNKTGGMGLKNTK